MAASAPRKMFSNFSGQDFLVYGLLLIVVASMVALAVAGILKGDLVMASAGALLAICVGGFFFIPSQTDGAY